MKILDRYILTNFLFNFISAFSIVMLIFVFQTIWVYADEWGGKGLSIWIIVKFIIFYLPTLVPLIVPLTVVLASIMSIGALAETYELASMKASGMSVLRSFRTLIIFMVLLSGLVFFVANNLQPMAYQKARIIRENIKKKQPSLAISEGLFNYIGNYSIKVKRKSGENGQYLHDIIIHQNDPDDVNRTVIKAQEGEFVNDIKSANILKLVLKNGTYYREFVNGNRTYPFIKTNFNEYILNIDLGSFNDEVDFNQTDGVISYKMMNVKQLSTNLDSLYRDFNKEITVFADGFYRRTGVPYLHDKTSHAPVIPKDTLRNFSSVHSLLKNKAKLVAAYSIASDANESLMNNLSNNEIEINYLQKVIAVYELTLSDKIALAVTCLILFFVAAPLGALIRKGGMGLPLVVAIGLFLSYYFSGMLFKGLVEKGYLHPLLAPWMPALILLPFGLLFTISVNQDKGVIEFNEIIGWLKRIFKRK